MPDDLEKYNLIKTLQSLQEFFSYSLYLKFKKFVQNLLL